MPHRRIRRRLAGTVLHAQRLFTWLSTPHYSFATFGSWISDLGGIGGIGIFVAFLGFFGLLHQRKEWIAPTLILIMLSFIERSLLLYAAMILSWSSAQSITYLLERKWTTPDLKHITLLLIACGIAFSTLSYARMLSESAPHDDLLASLDALKEITHDESVIFSAAQEAPFIEWSGRSVVLPLTYAGPDAMIRLNHSESLLHGYNLDATLRTLQNYNVTHIYITPQMIRGGVWSEPEQGLHFLLRNEHFLELYHARGYGIWEVTY